jgi:hypothetical protein
MDLEIAVLEVSGAPCDREHTHYVGDRNKIAKSLKAILNYIRKKYPGDFEDFRRIKAVGIQIYGTSDGPGDALFGCMLTYFSLLCR